MKNIIAAVDFSDVADKVIDQAANLAKLYSANLWIIHVETPDPALYPDGYVRFLHSDRCKEKEVKDEYRHINTRAKEIEKDGISVITLFPEGNTVDTLLQEENYLHADLVVTGSHAHGHLYQLCIGTVTESLLRRSICPLMIVPAERKVSSLRANLN